MLWPQRHLSPTPVGVGVGTSLVWAVDQTLLRASLATQDWVGIKVHYVEKDPYTIRVFFM